MPTFLQGPINIQQGNTANFAVEYLDSDGNLTVPSSGNISITYVNTSNSNVTDSVPLSNNHSFFVGSWSAITAALGIATWIATATGSTTTMATGQLRIIQRRGA